MRIPLSYKRLPPVEKGVMKTLPPAGGMVLVVAFSLLFWACIASIVISW